MEHSARRHPQPEPARPEREQRPQDEAQRHVEMMRKQHEGMLWTNFTNAVLGLWLVSSPFTFAYTSAAMTWSDAASGVLLFAFAVLSFSLRFDHARWGACAIGLWLLFAPLLFWAPNPAAYLNDTLVGMVVIALSLLVPMMPGRAHHMVMMANGPDIPPGWTYNPSSWPQRVPMIALAFVGLFLSRYLAAFQLGYVSSAWDPFFGASTERVLTSEVSRMWPISDAGLGALAYTLEALMGFMGDARRWRTMPWMVLFFFILVVPLGVTHVILVISQPVAVGAWCTLCLAAAAVMLAMIPLAVDEVVAMGQFLRRSVRSGQSFWWTFWVGGTIEGGSEDCRTPRWTDKLRRLGPSMVWGVSVPWTLAASALLGLWLTVSPAVFGTSGPAADSDHLVGALVLTIAVIAMAEVIRGARLLNSLLALWLIVAPWVLTGFSGVAVTNEVIAGILVGVASLPRGRVTERYARWDRYVI